MSFSKILIPAILAGALVACASDPAAAPPKTSPTPATAPVPVPPAPVSTVDAAKAEADAASALEKKFQEAAKSYKVVQKDGKTMYCKREKPMGSSIPTMQCISEAQLRLQVEQMDDLRDRMRNSNGRCTISAGCGAGS